MNIPISYCDCASVHHSLALLVARYIVPSVVIVVGHFFIRLTKVVGPPMEIQESACCCLSKCCMSYLIAQHAIKDMEHLYQSKLMPVG